jgi:hypothetical protein
MTDTTRPNGDELDDQLTIAETQASTPSGMPTQEQDAVDSELTPSELDDGTADH